MVVTPSVLQPAAHVVMCLEHGKPRELICIHCQKKVCHTCALFGGHKGHDVREKTETMNEIQLRMEVLIEMYSLVEQECMKLGEQSMLKMYQDGMVTYKNALKEQVTTQFDQWRAILAAKEQQLHMDIEASFH